MQTARWIHRVAIFCLLLVASLSVRGAVESPMRLGLGMYWFTIAFGIVIWTLLILKLFLRPRQWGFGLGIFLFLVVGFQTTLWCKAIAHPERIPPGVNLAPSRFILSEIPIAIAGLSCLLLRFYYPKAPLPPPLDS